MSITETVPVPPHVKVLDMIFGTWAANAVSCVAKLGIPDLVKDGAKSVDELANDVGAHPEALYRLLRATASVGVLAEERDGRFSQTPLSDVLRTDAVPSVRAMAIFNIQEWHSRAWERLEYSVRTGNTAFDAVYGRPLFQYLSDNPEAAQIFNEAMTGMSTGDGPMVTPAYDFRGIRSIVDIGGGHGLLLATVLAANPGLTGTLYDMPHVTAGAMSGPLSSLSDRVTIVSGDMFEFVPAGADAYMMKYIIHDWPDDKCIKILQGCRRGVNTGGKLLVIDMVIQPGNDPHFGKLADLEMMLIPSGKERTEAQFRDLLAAAGWKLNRVITTPGHLSIVEGVPS